MRLFIASLTMCLGLTAQTVTVNPATPTIPASLSVFADQGDLTYCVATAVKGTKPLIQLTCRRSGVTHITITYIDTTTFVSNGDETWEFLFNNAGNPQQVMFEVSANVKDPTGQLTPSLKSSGLITWSAPSSAPSSVWRKFVRIVKGN